VRRGAFCLQPSLPTGRAMSATAFSHGRPHVRRGSARRSTSSASFALPVAVYLLAFVVADTLLSLTFLAWPLLGVNYLRHVNERVWRLNFSPPAKLLNSAVFLLLLLAGHPYAAATAATCALVLKSVSLLRMLRLILARPSSCFAALEVAQP
jgi:hypothetical protein